MYIPTDWTYGSELELADLDTRKILPEGNKWDFKDGSIANSNGLANDPKKEFNIFGGEINVKPCSSIEDSVNEIIKIYKSLNYEFTINYTSNFHIHVRVPGLSSSLEDLKKLQQYISKYSDWVWKNIDPIPVPNQKDYDSEEAFKGAKRRYKRRKGSHNRTINNNCYTRMMNASSIKEFYEAHAPLDKDGKLCWGVAPRASINLQQLFNETDTVEFRHFTCSTDKKEIESCFIWCKEFLNCALNTGEHPENILKKYDFIFPKFKEYDYEIDKIFVQTAVTMNTRKEALANIERLKKEGILK